MVVPLLVCGACHRLRWNFRAGSLDRVRSMATMLTVDVYPLAVLRTVGVLDQHQMQRGRELCEKTEHPDAGCKEPGEDPALAEGPIGRVLSHPTAA